MMIDSRFVAIAVVLLAAGLAAQEQGTDEADQQSVTVETPFYGNTTCPVSGEEVDREVFAQVGNQKVYTCCKKCKSKVEADPEMFLAKAYPADRIVEAGNTKCPAMGETVDPEAFTVWQGRKVHYCCAMCEADFLVAPERLLTLALHPGMKELGNEHCLVMKDEEVDPSSFFVYGDLLINSCCADCASRFASDPSKYLPGHEDPEGDEEGGQDDDHGGDHDDHHGGDGGGEDGGMHGGHKDHDGHHR